MDYLSFMAMIAFRVSHRRKPRFLIHKFPQSAWWWRESMWITRGSSTMGFPSYWITWSSDVKFGSLFLPVKQFNPVVLSLILFLLCWIVSFLVESLLFCFLPASFFVVLCLVVSLLLLNSLPNVVLSPLTPQSCWIAKF